MRVVAIGTLFSLALGGFEAARTVAQTSSGAGSGPLPNVEQLRQRAVSAYAKTAETRERSLCRELITVHEIDSKGREKKTETVEQESFFVHGREITQTLAKDGKPLSESEQKKQSDAVRKKIDEAMKGGPNKRPEGEISTSDILRLPRLTNERRVLVSGRPTIVFDAAGDQNQKAKNIPERFIQAMVGTISIDEQTGSAQDINMRGVKDVKVGGGMVANVHKGFYVHVLIAPQPDGFWVVDRVYAAGDARVGLFLHPTARFEQKTEGCTLSNVTAGSVETLHEGK